MSTFPEYIEDKELSKLLKKASHPIAGKDFSREVMNQVYQAETRSASVKRYIRFSWVFILISILLSLKLISLINAIQSVFEKMLNMLLPGLSDTLSYLILIIIAGLVLYELNSLVTQYFSRTKKKIVLI
jgi:hypothetical protein